MTRAEYITLQLVSMKTAEFIDRNDKITRLAIACNESLQALSVCHNHSYSNLSQQQQPRLNSKLLMII